MTLKKNDDVFTTHFSAGPLTEEIQAEIINWHAKDKMKQLWSNDAALWTNTDESKWTGWLEVANQRQAIPEINILRKEMQAANITDVVVLGMGGSSLCPAMLAETFGKIKGCPTLHVLDSTDPAQIHDLEKKINLEKTYFIVSSKSGSTLEPNIFKDYFYNQLQIVLKRQDVGSHFIAITDPGTQLVAQAKKEDFGAIFAGVPSIGGRYSALSDFGMVPLGLMGVDVNAFLDHVIPMQEKCGPDGLAADNPGLVLGVILGVCANHNKNKVTLIASPGIHALGAWLEQLLAESTGKNGKGIIPVDQEPLGKPEDYADDRVFAYIRLATHTDQTQDKAIDALEKAGHVVVRLTVADIMHLGAELYRWEIATAVAGSVIGIDPFNQPDVEESKVLALKMTSEYEKTQTLPTMEPFFQNDEIALFTSESLRTTLKQQSTDHDLQGYIAAFLQLARKNDYVTFSAFIEMTPAHTDLIQVSRKLIRNHTKLATCLGFGPRFLHSTGQAYKGGPNTGLFLQLTADHPHDIAVPHRQFTFGLVISAQAQADFTVLSQRGRRVLRIHLGKNVNRNLKTLQTTLEAIFRKGNHAL